MSNDEYLRQILKAWDAAFPGAMTVEDYPPGQKPVADAHQWFIDLAPQTDSQDDIQHGR